MILIIDQKQAWSIFETPHLVEKKSGFNKGSWPVQGVSAVGLIVNSLGDETVLKVDGLRKNQLEPEEGALIKIISKRYKKLPIWLVSDDAFFNSLPVSASSQLLPFPYKRSGRTGLTHNYLLEEAAKELGRSPLEVNLITLFLDEESTAVAIKDGVAVEVSTSGSLLDGLPGSTSSGSIDNSFVLKMVKKEGLDKTFDLLTKKSGLLGYSGLGSSLENVITKPKLRQNPKFTLALKIYLHRLILLLGAYSALLGRVDGVVFSGVLGLKSTYIREDITRSLTSLRSVNVLNIEAKPRLLAAEILHHRS